MTDEQLRACLDWFMCSDPWVAGADNHRVIEQMLDAESRKRGQENWVVAFHEWNKAPKENGDVK